MRQRPTTIKSQSRFLDTVHRLSRRVRDTQHNGMDGVGEVPQIRALLWSNPVGMTASAGAAIGGGELQVRGFRKEVRGAGLFASEQWTQSPTRPTTRASTATRLSASPLRPG
jgi:hypothetical protein